MTFDDLLRLTRRRWWVVLLVALLGAVAGYALEAMKPQTYEATGRVVIGPALDVEGSIIESTGSLTRGTLPQTLAEVVTGSEVRRVAERRLDAPAGSDYEVDAVVIPETSVVEVDVTGPDREVTVELAAALLRQTESLFEGLYPIFDVVLLDEPDAPQSPVAPDPVFGAITGGLAGLVLGLVLAAWWGQRHDGAEPAGTLEDDGGAPQPTFGAAGEPEPATAEPVDGQERPSGRRREEKAATPKTAVPAEAASAPRTAAADRSGAREQPPLWEEQSWVLAWTSGTRPAQVDDPFEIVEDPTSEPSWLRGTEGGPRFNSG